MPTSPAVACRPLLMFDPDEVSGKRTPDWCSAQSFLRRDLDFLRTDLNEPELSQGLWARLSQVNGLFLVDDLFASGVYSLRDLTYLACLATQPDYLFISHEALGMDIGQGEQVNPQTNIAAWAELLYVLRVEESQRCWPELKGTAAQRRLTQKYKSIAMDLYERLIPDFEWGTLSSRVGRRCTARALNIPRWW